MRIVSEQLNAPNFPIKGVWEFIVAPQRDDFNPIFTFYARHYDAVIQFEVHKYCFNSNDLPYIVHSVVDHCYTTYAETVLNEVLTFLGRSMYTIQDYEIQEVYEDNARMSLPPIQFIWSS